MSCNDCNYSNCPFKTDPFDEYREVCIKCGKSYSFRRNRNNYWLFIILWTIFGILLFTEPNPQPEFEPETESTPVVVTRE